MPLLTLTLSLRDIYVAGVPGFQTTCLEQWKANSPVLCPEDEKFFLKIAGAEHERSGRKADLLGYTDGSLSHALKQVTANWATKAG